MMYVIYVQASDDARARPSDKRLASGERLQFIGVRSTDFYAYALAARESERVNGVAAVYRVEQTQAVFVAAYAKGIRLDIVSDDETVITARAIEPVAGSAVIELTPDENERFRSNAARMLGMDVDAYTHAELPAHLRGKRNG